MMIFVYLVPIEKKININKQKAREGQTNSLSEVFWKYFNAFWKKNT